MLSSHILGVITKFDLELYGQILASVFNPFDSEAILFCRKISKYYKENDNLKMFIGIYNGVLAAISCLYIENEMGGIYDIVTIPKFQNKGIGTYMTSMAVKELQIIGCEIVGMQALKEGAPFYKKLWFLPFGKSKVYSRI